MTTYALSVRPKHLNKMVLTRELFHAHLYFDHASMNRKYHRLIAQKGPGGH